MRIIGIDPAGKKTGICGLQVENNKLSIYMDFLLQAPSNFNSSQRTQYVSHLVGALLSIDKPDIVASESPWGQGFSSQALKELIGAIKSSYWETINWQGVSEARRAVLGDGYGGSKKRETAEWFLQYDWDLKSKRIIERELAQASLDTDDGYDILDAILHALCYLIANNLLLPKSKPEKKPSKKRKALTNEIK